MQAAGWPFCYVIAKRSLLALCSSDKALLCVIALLHSPLTLSCRSALLTCTHGSMCPDVCIYFYISCSYVQSLVATSDRQPAVHGWAPSAQRWACFRTARGCCSLAVDSNDGHANMARHTMHAYADVSTHFCLTGNITGYDIHCHTQLIWAWPSCLASAASFSYGTRQSSAGVQSVYSGMVWVHEATPRHTQHHKGRTNTSQTLPKTMPPELSLS